MYEHQEEVRWHGCKDIYLSAGDCDIILEKLEQIKELDPEPSLLNGHLAILTQFCFVVVHLFSCL